MRNEIKMPVFGMVIACSIGCFAKGTDNAIVFMAVQHSMMCLTYNDEGAITQQPCTGKSNQKVFIQRVDEEKETFQLKMGDFFEQCIGFAEIAAEDGTRLKLMPCATSPNQYFRFSRLGGDFLYKNIINIASNKCLDVETQSNKSGTIFHYWTCADFPSQQIHIQSVPARSRQLPKKIWSFWDTGEAGMPAFYRANVDVWRKRLGKDWQIVVLNSEPSDPSYFGKYLSESAIPTVTWIDSKIIDKPKDYKRLNPRVVFSDFVRLEILEQEGGFWMDPSIMLHNDLSEFVDVLENFSAFLVGGYTSRSQATPEMRWADSLENFFIAAFPQTPLIKAWNANFRRYWELKTNTMPIEDHPMYNGSEGLKINPQKYFGKLANYLNQHVALKYTLIKKPEYLKNIFIRGGVSFKDNGPFSMLDLSGWNDGSLVYLPNSQFADFLHKMKFVLISKFPSNDSVQIRDKMKSYDLFFDVNNIFGKLNSLPNSLR